MRDGKWTKQVQNGDVVFGVSAPGSYMQGATFCATVDLTLVPTVSRTYEHEIACAADSYVRQYMSIR